MATEITECLSDLSLPNSELVESASTLSDPLNSLVDWLFGNPHSHYGKSVSNHPVAHCGQIDPVLDTPLSPPLVDQRPTNDFGHDVYQSYAGDSWTNNP